MLWIKDERDNKCNINLKLSVFGVVLYVTAAGSSGNNRLEFVTTEIVMYAP
jgi:hypothetical protein